MCVLYIWLLSTWTRAKYISFFFSCVLLFICARNNTVEVCWFNNETDDVGHCGECDQGNPFSHRALYLGKQRCDGYTKKGSAEHVWGGHSKTSALLTLKSTRAVTYISVFIV